MCILLIPATGQGRAEARHVVSFTPLLTPQLMQQKPTELSQGNNKGYSKKKHNFYTNIFLVAYLSLFGEGNAL
jgi:hypothetical protein